MKLSRKAILLGTFTCCAFLSLILVFTVCVWGYECSIWLSNVAMLAPVFMGLAFVLSISERKWWFFIFNLLMFLVYMKEVMTELGNLFLLFWFGFFPVLLAVLFVLQILILGGVVRMWKRVLLYFMLVISGGVLILWIFGNSVVFSAFIP